MAHRYGEAILVRRASATRLPLARGDDARRGAGAASDDLSSAVGDLSGAPTAFAWRGVWYRVDAILATWRLRDRWWAGGLGAPNADVADVEDAGEDAPHAPHAPHADALRPTERVYFRALCRDPEGVQVFDLYYDVASGQWILDRAHD
jgi:hypothetical protein